MGAWNPSFQLCFQELLGLTLNPYLEWWEPQNWTWQTLPTDFQLQKSSKFPGFLYINEEWLWSKSWKIATNYGFLTSSLDPSKSKKSNSSSFYTFFITLNPITLNPKTLNPKPLAVDVWSLISSFWFPMVLQCFASVEPTPWEQCWNHASLQHEFRHLASRTLLTDSVWKPELKPCFWHSQSVSWTSATDRNLACEPWTLTWELGIAS